MHVKEIKLRPKIGVHDYETKKGHVVRFLQQRAKVKVTIMFRGRETTHPERGHDLLMRLAEDVKELGHDRGAPVLDGRNMVMVLAPTKTAARREGRSSPRVPKQKTNSAAKKRFKVTGTGRLLRRHAMKSHNLEKKTAKRTPRVPSRPSPSTSPTCATCSRLLGR